MTKIYESAIYSGAVLEIQQYPVGDRVHNTARHDPLAPKYEKTPEQKERACIRQSCTRLVRLLNTNFNTDSCFVTLTFDDAHLPADYAELHKATVNYIRRLKAACPGAKMVCVMGRGKGTGRFHLHLVTGAVDEALIRAKWTGGGVDRIESLREHNYYNGLDCGEDYTGLAAYLFKHYEPEQGKGKRWFQTKNLRQPERDPPEVAEVVYADGGHPPAPAGYRFVEMTECDTPRGCYRNFKYIWAVSSAVRTPCKQTRFTTVFPLPCLINAAVNRLCTT